VCMVEKTEPFAQIITRMFIFRHIFKFCKIEDMQYHIIREPESGITDISHFKAETEIILIGKQFVIEKMDTDNRLQFLIILSRIKLSRINSAQIIQARFEYDSYLRTCISISKLRPDLSVAKTSSTMNFCVISSGRIIGFLTLTDRMR